MPASGESVEPSLRKILTDCHISAIAIAVLLFWCLDRLFLALWGWLPWAAKFSFTALAHFQAPYVSLSLTFADRLVLLTTVSHFFSAFFTLAAASLLSQLVYGAGPVSSLSNYRTRLARRNRV